jgi:hypothetical protein
VKKRSEDVASEPYAARVDDANGTTRSIEKEQIVANKNGRPRSNLGHLSTKE